jgi:hypothetical protein
MWDTSVSPKTLPKENNRPIGENSPNPITLAVTNQVRKKPLIKIAAEK